MNNAKGHLAMLGANVMWGLMSPVAKMVFAAGVVAPLVMVDFRVAGAAALFWIWSVPPGITPVWRAPGCSVCFSTRAFS